MFSAEKRPLREFFFIQRIDFNIFFPIVYDSKYQKSSYK